MRNSLILGAALALFAAVPAYACTIISSATIELTACVDDEWKADKGTGAQEFVYATAQQDFGLQVITQTEVVPAQALHDAIIANATKAVSKPDDIKTIGERLVNIDGKPFNVLEYEYANDGNPILFQNYYYSQPGYGSVQLLFYSLSTDATAAAFKAGTFATTVKLGG